MPVRKRGDAWQVDVQVGGRRARQTVGTKATALEVEAKLRRDLERERVGLSPNRTLKDALADYLETGATALRSFDSLLYVAKVIRPFCDRPIDRIADAAADVIRDGQKRGRTPATINRQLALLRRLGNLAYKWGWTDSPAGKRVELLRENQERHVYLDQHQVAAIASQAAHEGTRDAIWLAATTGLRRGELLALRPEHYRDGALWLATSKSGRPRRVPVPADARYICERLPLAVTVVALRKDFDRARRAAGLPGVRFHDLRHTFASWAIDAGVDLRLLKDLMGHSTMQMTSRYAHLEDRHHDQAMRKMAKKRKPVTRT
jgi:integrase